MFTEYKQLSYTAEQIDAILAKADDPATWDEATKQAVRAAIGLSFNADGSIIINGITIEPLGTTKF